MSRGINKTISIGNVCADPESRQTNGGGTVTNIRLAMNGSYKDRNTGERVETVEYITVVMFNRLAEVAAEYLSKGSKVYIEGRIQTRKWQDQDGNDRYSTEIVANDMQMLDSRGGDRPASDSTFTEHARQEGRRQQKAQGSVGIADGDGFDDSIPF